jgi:hypothetical protein
MRALSVQQIGLWRTRPGNLNNAPASARRRTDMCDSDLERARRAASDGEIAVSLARTAAEIIDFDCSLGPAECFVED